LDCLQEFIDSVQCTLCRASLPLTHTPKLHQSHMIHLLSRFLTSHPSFCPRNPTFFSIIVSAALKPSQPSTSSHHSIHQSLGHFRPPSYLHNHPCIFQQSPILKNPILKHPVEISEHPVEISETSCRTPADFL